METLQPRTYPQVRDLYETLGSSDPQFQGMDLPTFASELNRRTGTTAFAAGMEDNIVKQASYAIDKFLRPVSDVTESLGAQLPGALGFPQFEHIGREMGRYLPRGMAETLAVFGAWPVAAAGIASSAAAGYTETGSKAAGAVQGAATGLLPASVRLGGRLFTDPFKPKIAQKVTADVIEKGVTKSVTGWVNPRPSTGMLERVAEEVGRNVGATVNMEAAIQGTSLAMGQGLAAFDDDHVAMLVAGTAPFTVLDMMRALPRPGPGKPRSAVMDRMERETANASARVKAHLETLRDEVDLIVKTGAKGKTEVETLQKKSALHQHFDGRISEAIKNGTDIDLYGQLYKQADGKELDIGQIKDVDDLLDSYIDRKILAWSDDKQSLKVIGKPATDARILSDLDIENWFLGKDTPPTTMFIPRVDISKEKLGVLKQGDLPLQERPRVLKARTESIDPETGQTIYRDIETEVGNATPAKRGDATPIEQGPIPEQREKLFSLVPEDRPKHTLPLGEGRGRPVEPIPQRLPEPKMPDTLTPESARAHLDAYWRWLRQESGVPRQGKLVQKQGYSATADAINPATGKKFEPDGKDLAQPENVLTTEMPEGYQQRYVGEEAKVLHKLGLKNRAELFPPGVEPGRIEMTPPSPAETLVRSREMFVKQVKDLLSVTHPATARVLSGEPGAVARARELLDVEPTVGEKFARLQQLSDSIDVALRFATDAGFDDARAKAIALREGGRDREKVRAVYNELKASKGKHSQFEQLLSIIAKDHQRRLDELATMEGVLPVSELANRRYQIELDRLAQLTQAKFALEEKMLTDVGAAFALAESRMGGKEVSAAQEQATFATLREMAKGKIQNGEAIVAALSKVNADMTVGGQPSVLYYRYERPMTTIDLPNEALYIMFHRAAELADPIKWAEAKTKAEYRANKKLSDEDVAWQYIRGSNIKGQRWAALQDAKVYDTVLTDLEAKGLHFDSGDIDLGEHVQNSAILAAIEDTYALESGMSRKFEEGTSASEAMKYVLELARTPNKDAAWWSSHGKAQLRFHPDGSVNWEKSKSLPVERAGREDTAAKYNKLLEVMQAGEFPVRFAQTPNGELTIRYDLDQRYDVDNVFRKLEFLEAVGYIDQARIDKINAKISYESMTPEQRTQFSEGYLGNYAKEYTQWRKTVENLLTEWRRGTVKSMTEMLQAKTLARFEDRRPVPPASGEPEVVMRPEVNPLQGSAEAAFAMSRAGKGDSLTLIRDAQTYFDSQWKDLGLDATEGAFYTDVAMRIAAAFPDMGRGRIAHTARQAAGEYVGLASRNYLVGVREADMYNRMFDDKRAPYIRASMMLHTLAHELSHSVFFGRYADDRLSPRQLKYKQESITWATALGAEGRAEVYARWAEIVEPIGSPEQLASAAKIAGENPQEFLADLAALMVKGIASPDLATQAAIKRVGPAIGENFAASAKKLLGEAVWTDAHQQNFLNGLYVSMLDVMPALDGYFKRVAPGRVTDMKPLIKSMKEALALNAEKINEAIRVFDNLEQVDRGRYEQLMAQGWLEKPYDYRLVREMTGDVPPASVIGDVMNAGLRNLGLLDHASTEKHFGITPNWYHKNFMTPHYLSRQFPALKPVIDLVMRFRGMANDYAVKMSTPFMTKASTLGKQTLDVEGVGLKRIANNPKVERATSAVALIKQAAGKVLTRAQIEDQARRHGVTDKADIDAIESFHRAAEESATQIQQTKVLAMRQNMRGRYGLELMMGDKALPFQTAWDVAGRIEESLWMAQKDPVNAAFHLGQALQLVPQTPRGQKQFQALQEALREIGEWDKKYADASWYMPETRLGEFMVAFRKGDKWGTAGFHEAAKLDEYVKQLEADPTVTNIKPWRKSDRAHEFEGVDPDFATTWNKIEKQSLLGAMIEAEFDEATMRKFFEMYEPGEAGFRSQQEHTMEVLKRERKLAPGRETINMPYAFLKHIQGTSNLMAKAVTKAQVAMAMSDPAIRSNPALRNMARDYFNMVLNPSAKEFSFLKRMTFAYYMGLNFSSAMIEFTQPLLMLVPNITRDTGSMGVGYKYMANAAGLLFKRAKSKLSGQKGTFGDAELDDVVTRAQNEQIVDFGVHQEFQDLDALFGVNLRSILQGKEGSHNPISWSKTMLDKYAIFARDLYSNAPRANSLIAAIALYKIARENGIMQNGKLVKLDHEGAYDYMKSNVRASTLGGGTAGRPLFFAKSGRYQGALGLAYSLMSYTFGMFSHIAALSMDSIDVNKRLLPSERTAARKALGQVMATQVALAGAMGLPLAPGIIALLQQLMPDKEIGKTVEDTISKMVGEDEEAGGVWTDFVMKGAPFAVGGIDLSSRMELSNIMGLSPYDGWQASNLFGPFASILENMGRAATQASRGAYGSAAESIIPVSWRNVIKHWRDDWVMRDGKDRVLLEPTSGELLLDMVGFRPTRLSKMREKVQMAKQGDKAWSIRNQQFHDEMAQLMARGDTESVREGLIERQQNIAGYNAVAGAQRVVERVLEMTLPYDFAREGATLNAAERQRLAQSAGVPQTTEMQRLVTKKALERSLGVPGAGTLGRTQVRMAQLIDQLMAQNPLLSKQEAGQIAAMMMGRQTPTLLGQPRSVQWPGQQAAQSFQ